jgi:hypothetical protein
VKKRNVLVLLTQIHPIILNAVFSKTFFGKNLLQIKLLCRQNCHEFIICAILPRFVRCKFHRKVLFVVVLKNRIAGEDLLGGFEATVLIRF